MIKEKEVKKITFIEIISWILGISFGFMGLVDIFSFLFVPGITLIIMASVLLPPINKMFKERMNFELSIGVKIAVIIIGFVVVGKTMSIYPTDANTKQADSLYYQIEKISKKIDNFDYIDVSNTEKIKLLKEQCELIPQYLAVGKDRINVRISKLQWEILGGAIKSEIRNQEDESEKQKFKDVLKFYLLIQENILEKDNLL
ncbi:MAG: hypothetical protein ISS28_08425 [Candidatus Cloacimonetes bacterium]|nr:hypothetical protein [Candidatus Cloacimonadota bacterium]MBL7087097.1 hypothetical protein [Candidatus Cloacimonadota bacterium]